MGERHRAARRDEVERNDQALLDAARAVFARDGMHTTVASIAATAGVGIGSLYRRYPTKEKLYERLCLLSLQDYLTAAETGLTDPDPWNGLATYIKAAVLCGTGTLAPIAETLAITDDMAELGERGDTTARQVIERAHDAGVLRADVNDVDIALLIEQLGRSPLVEQVTRHDNRDLHNAARHARDRLIALALDGLRAHKTTALPEPAPDWTLFTERWRANSNGGTPG